MDFTIQKVKFTNELKSELLKNKLHNDVPHADYSGFLSLLTDNIYIKTFSISITCPEYVYILTVNSIIIGWSCNLGVKFNSSLSNIKLITNVFIKNEFRSNGLGKKLFKVANNELLRNSNEMANPTLTNEFIEAAKAS